MQQTLEARVAALEATVARLSGTPMPELPPPLPQITRERRRLPPRVIAALEAAAEEFNVTVGAILDRGKRSDVSIARQVGATILVRVYCMSHSEVGRYLERDHSAVDNAVTKVEARCQTDADFGDRVERVRQALRQDPRAGVVA